MRERIEQIAAVKRRYGYRRVYRRLRREGCDVNRKRVYRLYREAGLRRRKRKWIRPLECKPLSQPTRANHASNETPASLTADSNPVPY